MIATFLPPLKPVAQSSVGVGATPAGAGFIMQPQQGHHWCWAAVAASVSSYMAPFTGVAAMSQCDIASACFNHSCCPPRPGGPDDVDWMLEDAFSKSHHGEGLRREVDAQTTYPLLRKQIANHKPVGCHISWPGDPGHFVALVDFIDGVEELVLKDPLRVHDGTYTVAQLKTLHGGAWDYYYLTQ